MLNYNLFSLVIGLALIVLGSSSPSSYYTKCKKSDVKCLTTQTTAALPLFSAGIAEYGVRVMDPLLIDKIDASNKDLKLIVTNITITGLQNCIAKKVEFKDDDKLNLRLEVTGDLNGHYEMDGQILILPLKGQGKLEVNLKKAVLDISLILEKTMKEGKEHFNIKGYDHSYNLKARSNVHFENLFSGNPEVARAASEAISASGNEIIFEVGPPVIKHLIDVVVKNINRFFHRVPIEDIIDE